jgi:hypothetical protein
MPQAAVEPSSHVLSPVDAYNAYAKRLGLSFRCDTNFVFDHPGLKILHDVWQERATGGIVPFRKDFNLRCLKDVASNILIVERHSGIGATFHRVRLAGSNISEIFGDMNGRVMSEIIAPKFVERWNFCVDVVLEYRRPLHLKGNFEVPQASYLGGEVFIAPMRNAAGQVNMTLAAIYFHRRTDVAVS